MKRFVDGAGGEFFFQKRVPKGAPDWLQTATFTFPSGRTATELVANDAAHLVWAVNLGVIDFNPHPVRRADLDCPDELRVDLDPMPGVRWNTVRKVAMCVKEVLEEHGLGGFPKTSGSRGIHVNVRIEPRWDYVEVRRAALALAREVERRLPKHATSKWWKEERHGVFVDYNQNARDRTIASGYSVRPVPDARVCCPLEWDEVPDVEPAELRLDTVPGRLRKKGDPRPRSTSTPARSISCSTSPAATRRGASATRPGRPTSPSSAGEPKRVQPSRAKRGPRRADRAQAPAVPADGSAMDANQYVLVHGMRRTRSVLAGWGEDPWPVVRTWLARRRADLARAARGGDADRLVGQPGHRLQLHADDADGIELTGSSSDGPELARAGAARVRLRRRLHRRRHPAALGRASAPGSPASIHEKARPIAFGWVIAVTCFSLLTQRSRSGSRLDPRLRARDLGADCWSSPPSPTRCSS